MRLTKLTLHGFKSFADATEFTFDQPVTGIVGPNGCGKSNVVDAIKWVLGERSSKSLRGTEMVDVIFAGSAGRKPQGMASVKLTFDNPPVSGAKVLTAPPALAVLGEEDAAASGSADAESAEAMDAAAQPGSDAGADQPAADEAVIQRSAKRTLPIDSDVVEIERRLYRDGGSDYLINGKQARLKDIRELFLDTGVGADAYSIIEQGKVDAMLLASPQERRVIFEEAAGVAKYKQRRIEAQRKLERAEANLKVTREELESTERRLRLIKGQAAKARTFQQLDAELRAWKLTLALDQYDDLQTRIDALTSRQRALGEERDQAHAHLAELEARRQEAELRRHDRAQEARRVEQELMGVRSALAQAEQRRAMLGRLVEQATRERAGDEAAQRELSERTQACELAITSHREEAAAAAEKLSEAERRLQEAGSARAALLEKQGETQREANTRGASASRIERERITLAAAMEAEDRRAAGLREQLESLRAREERLTQERAKAEAAIEASRADLKRARAQVQECEAQISSLEEQLAKLGESRSRRAGVLKDLEQELVRIESRRSTLEEMSQARVGFAEAVRRVMALLEKGEAPEGVIAPLADLIEPAPGIAPHLAGAVEVALGADLQGVVLAPGAHWPESAALRAVDGRVTFLTLGERGAFTPHDEGPGVSGGLDVLLADIDGDEDAEASAQRAGASRLVSLRSLVRAREGEHGGAVDALLDRLLDRTYLVSDLAAAELLRAGPLHGARLITRAGEVVDEAGRVTSGPLGTQAADDVAQSLLLRRGELERLRGLAAELSARVAQERQSLAAVDSEAGELTRRLGAARQELNARQKSAAGEQTKLDRAGFEASRLGRDAAQVAQEAEQVRARAGKIEGEVVSGRAKVASLIRLWEEESAAANAALALLAADRARADQAGEQVAAARVEVGELTQVLAGVKRELSRLESTRDELARKAREAEHRLQAHESRLREHAVAINEATHAALQASQQEGPLAESLAQLQEASREAEALTAGLTQETAGARQRSQTLERDFHGLEVSRRELEVKRESLEERALADASLDLRALLPEYRGLLQDEEGARTTRPDHADAQRTIDDLRGAIKKLGNVNLDAIAEESTLEGQNEALVKQVADIEAAREQLSTLIEQLNTVSKARFEEVFTTIQRQFGGEEGMFRKLFGGGRAEVRLMPLVKEVEQADGTITKVQTDEVDVLESGIEVIAKPPGKEPRSISQLSGGEKTLTAVALLMSIFRSKPSCFCVLDEVDAALDEGNVGRFNAAVREYTDRSSFIVITHNKRTMQNADKLFGVTMQERGVSTRVSVRFEQVGKDGSIQIAANSTAPLPEPTAPAPAEKKPRGRKRSADASPAIPSQRVEAPLVETPEAEGTPAAAASEPIAAMAEEPVAKDRSPEPAMVEVPPAPVMISAPLGLGENPEQTTTLGMSPLKRALAKLREMQPDQGRQN